MCEERDATGVVTKRFFAQGMRVESGPVSGTFFYTRDHLGSIRELTDGSGNVRARYAYDPYGRRIRLTGDVEADFGFAGMFWAAEANLLLTHYRAYDPELGRWLSRDPLRNAEMKAGQNLYAYVGNGPVNNIDPEGLISTLDLCGKEPGLCAAIAGAAEQVVEHGGEAVEAVAPALEGAGEACLQAVEGRIGDLLERTMDIAPDLANYRFDIWSEATDRFAQVGELFSVSPIAPSYLFELEAEFQELAWALVERWSVSGEDPLALFSEASQMLSLLLRWNPATW